MASTFQGASSSSGASLVTEVRPEAEPLPSKIGELGYTGTQHEDMREISLSDGPSRTTHPAERTTTRGSAPNGDGGVPSTSASSTRSKRSIFSFLGSKGGHWKGLSYITLARAVLIFLALAGVIAAWAIVANQIAASPDTPPQPDTTGDSQGPTGKVPSPILIHVAFSIGVLFLLLFLERTTFQARAERYNFLNPSSMAANTGNAIMGLAPWNRPPLPTYAAALAGRGTGDVEDNIIAQPPPPAYGNTRGSTLLLANLLRNSLRSIPSRASQRVSQMSQLRRTDSPIGYDESELATDVERAQAVEATLTRLEEGGSGARSQ